MNRRILLFGKTGKLGRALAEALAPGNELTAVASVDADVRDVAAVERLIDAVAPNVIVNAAGALGIDPCEKDATNASLVNGLFPGHLARLAAERSAELIHFSTDAVFSGAKGRYLTEGDAPDPINVYGASKYLGELAVREVGGKAHVFRLSVLFGPDPKGNQFIERMLERARAGQGLKVADDVVSTPSYTPDIAAFVRGAVDDGLDYGLHHLIGPEAASLYDMVRAAVDIAGVDAEVARAGRNDFPGIGRKNSYTPLRSTHLSPLRDWREAMAEWLAGG